MRIHGHSRAVSRRGGRRLHDASRIIQPGQLVVIDGAAGEVRRAWRGCSRGRRVIPTIGRRSAAKGVNKRGRRRPRRRSDPLDAGIEISRRSRLGALRGSRESVVSIRVPPDRPMARRRSRAGGRKPAMRLSPDARGWRRGRSVHVRRGRVSSRVRCLMLGGRRRSRRTSGLRGFG